MSILVCEHDCVCVCVYVCVCVCLCVPVCVCVLVPVNVLQEDHNCPSRCSLWSSLYPWSSSALSFVSSVIASFVHIATRHQNKQKQ